MPKKMIDLDLGETSGVDHPAHLREGWIVMKSAELTDVAEILDSLAFSKQIENAEISKEESPMPEIQDVVVEEAPVIEPVATFIAEGASAEEVIKSLPESVVKMLEDERESLRKAAEASEARVAKAIETAEAALAKAAQSQAELSAEKEARADEAAIAKAAQWTHLTADPTVLGPGLRALAESNPVLADVVVKALASANETAAQHAIFTEVGTNLGSDTDTAWDEIQSKAKALVINKAAATQAEAIALVAETDPDLYVRYQNENAGGR
jgi:methylthioribose-1-phosphate isomerase